MLFSFAVWVWQFLPMIIFRNGNFSSSSIKPLLWEQFCFPFFLCLFSCQISLLCWTYRDWTGSKGCDLALIFSLLSRCHHGIYFIRRLTVPYCPVLWRCISHFIFTLSGKHTNPMSLRILTVSQGHSQKVVTGDDCSEINGCGEMWVGLEDWQVHKYPMLGYPWSFTAPHHHRAPSQRVDLLH